MVDIKFDADGNAALPADSLPSEQILCQLAEQLMRSNDRLLAIESLQKAVALKGPANFEIAWRLARAYASVQDFRQAFATVAPFYGISFAGVG